MTAGSDLIDNPEGLISSVDPTPITDASVRPSAISDRISAAAWRSGDSDKVTPPVSATETPLAGQEITVLISADGQLAVNQNIVTIEKLTTETIELLQQDSAAEEQPSIKLKADAGLAAAQLLAVLNALRESGVRKLNLITAVAR